MLNNQNLIGKMETETKLRKKLDKVRIEPSELRKLSLRTRLVMLKHKAEVLGILDKGGAK